MELKPELVPVPFANIDKAKVFYAERLGFTSDVDVRQSEGIRVVQLTPPGSACSIVLGEGMPQIVVQARSVPGLHLVVRDISEARETLRNRGVEVGNAS
jgi:hypothetical protein